MKYLSVCSGIEAASVAWEPLGWKPLALSEIEDFPRAVLKHRFPNVPIHGDFTKLCDEPWIVDADILVGGTPCQAFSVAGLRGSLSDERGNLSLEFIRLANAIDDLRRDAGRGPAYVLWENVPGVLSVSDNAFGAFLAGLVGHDAAVEPPRWRGWTNAGVVHGPRRVAAWRVLDAQHFGLAQRRKRVFVLAIGHPGAWRSADALLPIIHSLSGHPAPRREARKEFASGVAPSTGDISHCLNAGVQSRKDYETETLIAHTLGTQCSSATEDGTGRGAPLVPVAFHPTQDPISSEDVSYAMGAGSKAGCATVVVAFTQNQRDEVRTMEVAGALAAEPGAKQQTYLAFSCKDYGGDAGEIAPTLRSMGHDGSHANGGGQVAVAAASAVRRLTPKEAERLQGFPDGWTDIPWRGKPHAPDGPRYKALGNSFAVPVVRWIGQRIAMVDAIPLAEAAE